ncbi:MAG: hypothetical protein IMZ55_04920 [Acidobacteria bacterium]|nr:hypothetical protein [Acidobacteriota bacterium]
MILVGVASALLVASIVGLVDIRGTVAVHTVTLEQHAKQLSTVAAQREEMVKMLSNNGVDHATIMANMGQLLEATRDIKLELEKIKVQPK